MPGERGNASCTRPAAAIRYRTDHEPTGTDLEMIADTTSELAELATFATSYMTAENW